MLSEGLVDYLESQMVYKEWRENWQLTRDSLQAMQKTILEGSWTILSYSVDAGAYYGVHSSLCLTVLVIILKMNEFEPFATYKG